MDLRGDKQIDADPIEHSSSTPLEQLSGKTSIGVTNPQEFENEKNLSEQAFHGSSSPITTDAMPQEQWNHPSINIWRTVIACYGLFVMGMNDATYGVCTC